MKCFIVCFTIQLAHSSESINMQMFKKMQFFYSFKLWLETMPYDDGRSYYYCELSQKVQSIWSQV